MEMRYVNVMKTSEHFNFLVWYTWPVNNSSAKMEQRHVQA